MKLQIEYSLRKKFLTAGLLMLSVLPMRAEWVVMNPGEWMALAEGNGLINKQIQNQTNGQLKTAVLQNTMVKPNTTRLRNGNVNTAVTCKQPVVMHQH